MRYQPLSCALQAREKRRGKCAAEVYTVRPSTADNIQLYRHGESGARYSGTDSSGIKSLYRHKAGERTTAGESGGIYSSAQAQGQRSGDLYSQYPCRTTSRRHATPTPGFGGGVKMKLCQRVEVILFRPFSQPSSKNFGLNEVSLFHELF